MNIHVCIMFDRASMFREKHKNSQISKPFHTQMIEIIEIFDRSYYLNTQLNFLLNTEVIIFIYFQLRNIWPNFKQCV